jgi:hypothetical protein
MRRFQYAHVRGRAIWRSLLDAEHVPPMKADTRFRTPKGCLFYPGHPICHVFIDILQINIPNLQNWQYIQPP